MNPHDGTEIIGLLWILVSDRFPDRAKDIVLLFGIFQVVLAWSLQFQSVFLAK